MPLYSADYIVIIVFAVLMVVIGIVAKRKVKNMEDYFAGGKKVPWWMAAISHHMSGYSAFAFVGHATIAYLYGFSVWTFFAAPIFVAMIIGANVWAQKWVKLNVITPIEYLEKRFNPLTRQVFAWSGIGIKFIDEGVKLYSLAVVVHVITNFPLEGVIIGSGFVTIFYIMFGGLWATMLTDFAQFIIQFSISILLGILVLNFVGGWSSIWSHLPPSHSSFFSEAISPWFLVVYLVVIILSYNGGTWGLAQRFYSIGKPKDARKAAYLSAGLYLVYPFAIYIPIWAARQIVGEISNPEQAYVLVAEKLLGNFAPGLIGLFVSAIFAATMSMISSDINSLASVFTKDIYQRKINQDAKENVLLKVGMISTVLLGMLTIGAALITVHLQGAFNAMIEWYAAILGPVSIPLLFGMIYKKATWRGAMLSWGLGFLTFIAVKYGYAAITGTETPFALYTGLELVVAFGAFFLEGLISTQTKEEKENVEEIFAEINK